MSKLYFTRNGADRISRQRAELKDKLRSTQGQKGEAADVGGNQWHDNFSFEQLTRDEEMLNMQIRETNEKIRQMVIVDEMPSDTERLRIGHTAKLAVDDEEKIYVIGGYEDSDDKSTPPIISYLAPLIKPFIGKEEGYELTVMLGGKPRSVTLLEISISAPVKEE